MKRFFDFLRGLISVGVLLAGVVCFSAQAQPLQQPEATPGVEIVNISNNTSEFVSVFPQVAVSRSDPNLVAVAWRRYGMPIDVHALAEDRHAECLISISTDGGRTFTSRNMMDVLRRPEGRVPGGDGEPQLWGCNAPWVAIATDGTLYFGGALFSPGGDYVELPKAGRAGVTVSTDGGRTWSQMVPGLALERLAPGLRGLDDGMNTEHTPWDGANGIVDPITGTFYSSAGGYNGFSASDDRGRTFQTVYRPDNLGRGWERARTGGTADAAFGTLAVAIEASAAPNANCPCLALATSNDKGRTFTAHLVAEADEWNRQGPTRYPVPAASPANEGHFAIAAFTPDRDTVRVFYTEDGGTSWNSTTAQPYQPNTRVRHSSQASVGYTTDGRLLVTWRGFINNAAFYTFVAKLNGDSLGPTVLVTPELSIYPPLTFAGNYGTGAYDGGGDRTTWITANNEMALIATPFAPGGVVMDTVLARVPLNILE